LSSVVLRAAVRRRSWKSAPTTAGILPRLRELGIEATMMTTRKGVVAGGDIVAGASTLILAMGNGGKVVGAIDVYLHREAAEKSRRELTSPGGSSTSTGPGKGGRESQLS
jgi:hypothetical protein